MRAAIPMIAEALRRAVRLSWRKRRLLLGLAATAPPLWALALTRFEDLYRIAGMGLAEYLYPGVIILVVLLAIIAAADSCRANKPRSGVHLAQAEQGANMRLMAQAASKASTGVVFSLFPGIAMLALSPLAGIPADPIAIMSALAVLALIALALTCFAMVIATRAKSRHAFAAAAVTLMFPMWLFSGALFPPNEAPHWLRWIMRADPLSYGLIGLRKSLYLANRGHLCWLFHAKPAIAITALFALGTLMFAILCEACERPH